MSRTNAAGSSLGSRHDLHGVRSAGKGAKSIPARDRGDRRVAARMDRAQKRKTAGNSAPGETTGARRPCR